MLHRYKKSLNSDAFLGQTDHMDSFFESESEPQEEHGRLHVPEVPVVSGEKLLQLEKIQKVLPSRRDEAHFQ